MHAIQILRQMHADTKQRFKVILAADDPATARQLWQELQPLLDVHEELEDQLVYTPIAEDMGPGTPLGDWAMRHDADVAVVKELIAAANQLDAKQPEWRMSVAQVMDTLARHVMDEEGQIFGRIEQTWGSERLESVGAEMKARLTTALPVAAGSRRK
jgi:hemerythrin-like domain-containing protein